MREQWAAAVACDDFADRPRHSLVTITEDNRVAVAAPPGGSMKWKPGDVRELQAALTSAVLEALHRAGEA
jgi:hypothetical protein